MTARALDKLRGGKLRGDKLRDGGSRDGGTRGGKLRGGNNRGNGGRGNGQDAIIQESAYSSQLHVIAGDKDATMSQARKIVSAVVALVLFCGISSLLAALCNVEPSAVLIIPSLVVAVAVTVLGMRVQGQDRQERFYRLGTAIALAVLAIAVWPVLSAGGAQAANGFLYVLGAKSAEYQLLYLSGGVAELSYFCAVLSIGISFLCYQLSIHGSKISSFVIAALSALLLIFGYVQPGFWTAALAAGIIGCLCIAAEGKSGGQGDGQGDGTSAGSSAARALGVPMAAIVAVGVILTVVVTLIAGSGTVDTSAQRAAIREFAYTIQYGGASYAMPMGQLQNLGPRASSDKPAMQVELNGSTKEYLRGFVGESYDGSSWNSLDGQAVMDNQGLFYWLAQDGFNTNSQVSQAATTSGYSSVSPQTMSITMQGARGGYAYLPYSYYSGASISTATDMSFAKTAGSNSDTQQFMADGTLTSKSYLVQQTLEASQGAATGNLRTYLDDESAYRDFVYANYMAVPDDVRQTFQQVFGDPQQLTSEQAKVVVSKFLSAQASYNDAISTDNGGEDFVTYFLTQSRQGYSVHFATAATLLMRYYGVPARYVEGYMLDTSQAVTESQQESATADGTSGSTYDLTEQNAHAWVEYYLDGVGWIPFDVTPGFYDASYYEPTDNNQIEDDVQSWSVGDNAGSTSWESEQQQQQQEQQRVSEEQANTQLMILWSILGLVIVLVIAFIVRAFLKRRKIQDFLEHLREDDVAEVVPEGFAYGLFLGERCRKLYLSDSAPYTEQGSAAEAGGLCDADVFEAAANANSKMMFSDGMGANEEDRKAMLAFVDDVMDNLKLDENVLKRFYQRWVRCLW